MRFQKYVLKVHFIKNDTGFAWLYFKFARMNRLINCMIKCNHSNISNKKGVDNEFVNMDKFCIQLSQRMSLMILLRLRTFIHKHWIHPSRNRNDITNSSNCMYYQHTGIYLTVCGRYTGTWFNEQTAEMTLFFNELITCTLCEDIIILTDVPYSIAGWSLATFDMFCLYRTLGLQINGGQVSFYNLYHHLTSAK